jgi:putative Mg2+ transporter-C (MgtC) family protein
MRALLLRCLSLGGLHVHEIAVQAQEVGLEISALVGVGRRWSALVGGEDASDPAVEQAVQRVAAEVGVVRVRWMVADEV